MTVKLLLVKLTLVTVPPDVVVEMVTLPLLPLKDTPEPAVSLVTPVLVIVNVPDVVIGLPETCIPVPGLTATLVTVPAEAPELIEVMRPYESTVSVGYV